MGRTQQPELSRFVGLWLRVRWRRFQHRRRVGKRPERVLQRRQGHGGGRVGIANDRCKRVERLHGAIVNWLLESHATLDTCLDLNGYLGVEAGIIYSSC